MLGWAATNGLVTPGGYVVPSERFWAVLDACGVGGQARYLGESAPRLDPVHAVQIAASIVDGLDPATVETLARPDAARAFECLAAPRVVCRSSSAMEDGRAAAFPGVFTSVLHLDSAAALARAMAACWRSAFSAAAVRYLLRVRVEPVDFSLALLLQPQVEAAWYGVYVSADPVTGAADPLVELSDEGPDAVVAGGRPGMRARRDDRGWEGVDHAVSGALEGVHGAATRLAAHLGTEVDIEFAVPTAGGEPVILQCRPLTRVQDPQPRGPAAVEAGDRLHGRPCAGGRVTGRVGQPSAIAVVEHLTPSDYGTVLGHSGLIVERDVSPLSHVAVLCRELGVPLVCGMEGAGARLAGRWVTLDGGTGEIRIVAGPEGGGVVGAAPPRPEPAVTAVELLLRVLAEGRPGHRPAEEAARLTQALARDLRAPAVRVVACDVAPGEVQRLDRFGAEVFGPGFSAASFLAHVTGPPRGP